MSPSITLPRLGKIACFFLALLPSLAHAAAPVVTVSIKPLHSIVATIMEGTGAQPGLIVTGNASPHGFQIKPSQLEAIAHSDVLFYMADSFEPFLLPAIRQAGPHSLIVPVGEKAGVDRLPQRVGGLWEIDEDEAPQKGAPLDYHLWLSPANAGAIAQFVAETLSARYPEHKKEYMENAQSFRLHLQALDTEIRTRMQPLQGVPYIVFHDAYHYFEDRYGLTPAGSVTLEPEQPVSALRIATLRQKIRQSGARCVFREPQFPSPLGETVAEGTMAHTALLDPEGSSITPGPALYETLLRQLAGQFERCLKR